MKRSRCHGIFIFDALTALTIVAALAVALAVVTDRQRRALDGLAQTRQAAAIAEQTLVDLQQHHQFASPANAHVEIIFLSGGQNVSGMRWVQVRATSAGKTATLAGLVPTTEEAK